MATNYLTRSGATPTSEKIATMSVWVKPNDPAGSIGLFAQTASSSGNGVMFFINASSQLEFYCTNGSSQAARVVTNRVLKDTSAWYLLQCQIDTTQASNINRVKMFVNGEQIADGDMSIASYPSQNINLNGFDGSGNQIFGSLDNLSYNCKADIADAYFIDGSIIASNQFWSTDSTTGEIKPNTSPTISSFGANGYHLKFENANQGLDSKPSGASNFTTNGTVRKQEDCPSDNFATLIPSARHHTDTSSLSIGNLTYTLSSYTKNARSSLGMTAGKYYWEVKQSDINLRIGVMTSTFNNNLDTDANDAYYGGSNGRGGVYLMLSAAGTSWQRTNNNTSKSIDTYTNAIGSSANDILMAAVDVDAGKLWIGVNGTWMYSGNPATGANAQITFTNTSGDPLLVYAGFGTDSARTANYNFGNGFFGTTAISSEGTNASGIGKFEYDVPSGYTALSTKGLNS